MQENKIDYSMARRNPLDCVRFYDDLESTESRRMTRDQTSSMLTANFQARGRGGACVCGGCRCGTRVAGSLGAARAGCSGRKSRRGGR